VNWFDAHSRIYCRSINHCWIVQRTIASQLGGRIPELPSSISRATNGARSILRYGSTPIWNDHVTNGVKPSFADFNSTRNSFFSLILRSRRGQRLHWQRIQSELAIALDPPPYRISPGEVARDQFLRIADAYTRGVGKHEVTHFGEKSRNINVEQN